MQQAPEQRMNDLAEKLSDIFLSVRGKKYYRKAWPLQNPATGEPTNKYVVVAVFEVDKAIFDKPDDHIKATGLPARQGIVVETSGPQVCLCCHGSGFTKV